MPKYSIGLVSGFNRVSHTSYNTIHIIDHSKAAIHLGLCGHQASKFRDTETFFIKKAFKKFQEFSTHGDLCKVCTKSALKKIKEGR